MNIQEKYQHLISTNASFLSKESKEGLENKELMMIVILKKKMDNDLENKITNGKKIKYEYTKYR